MDAKFLQEEIRANSQLMHQVNQFVYTHPELGYEEYQCADFLTRTLKEIGLKIEPAMAGLETAFRATLLGDADRPRVGLVLLFDAVPAIEPDGSYAPNHACGHNVIAGAVIGAVAALASLAPRRGSVVVMGLPADEMGAPEVAAKGGGKALMAEAGVWDDLDVVLYAHPEFLTAVSHVSRWMTRYRLGLSGARQLTQRGELSGSVFGAVQELIGAVRELETHHSQEYVMLKGVWADGDVEEGCALNARLQVLVFGHTQDEIRSRIAELEQTVAQITEATQIPISMEPLGAPYLAVRPNHTLTEVVHQAMAMAGLEIVTDPPPLPFATDFGNISRRVPGALIGVGREGGWRFHTLEGAAEFGSDEAGRIMFEIADVLALTSMQLFASPSLIEEIAAEHAGM